jgi:hypothetical protein
MSVSNSNSNSIFGYKLFYEDHAKTLPENMSVEKKSASALRVWIELQKTDLQKYNHYIEKGKRMDSYMKGKFQPSTTKYIVEDVTHKYGHLSFPVEEIKQPSRASNLSRPVSPASTNSKSRSRSITPTRTPQISKSMVWVKEEIAPVAVSAQIKVEANENEHEHKQVLKSESVLHSDKINSVASVEIKPKRKTSLKKNQERKEKSPTLSVEIKSTFQHLADNLDKISQIKKTTYKNSGRVKTILITFNKD